MAELDATAASTTGIISELLEMATLLLKCFVINSFNLSEIAV